MPPEVPLANLFGTDSLPHPAVAPGVGALSTIEDTPSARFNLGAPIGYTSPLLWYSLLAALVAFVLRRTYARPAPVSSPL